MKRIFIFLIGVMMVIPLFAGPDDVDEICRRNTLVMAVLQMDKNGTGYSINETDKTKWSVTFDYDIFGNMRGAVQAYSINGRSTCNKITKKSKPDGTGSDGGDATPGDVNTFLKPSPMDVGEWCWCRMAGPVTSWWMYVNTYASEQECEDNCATYCARGLSENTAMSNNRGIRDAMFYAIW